MGRCISCRQEFNHAAAVDKLRCEPCRELNVDQEKASAKSNDRTLQGQLKKLRQPKGRKSP